MQIKLREILPLYLAGMIMLVFVVFPHHHHADFICFSASHCHAAVDTEPHSHEHDPFSGAEGCVKQLLQTEITKTLSLDYSHTGQAHHFSMSLFTLAGMTDMLSFVSGKNIFPDTTYHEKLHATVYTTNRAGRAPPIMKIC